MKIGAVYLVFTLLAVPMATQCQDNVEDPWAIVRSLEGVWEGEGVGFGQTSKVTHSWEFVLDGKFLRLETKSVSTTSEGKSEVHEDVGYVSWSEGEGVLRFRQFLSEGFVNTFTISSVDSTELGFNFEPENTEGTATLSVGMTLRFKSVDTYEMILERGKKGAELKACQTMSLRKVD